MRVLVIILNRNQNELVRATIARIQFTPNPIFIQHTKHTESEFEDSDKTHIRISPWNRRLSNLPLRPFLPRATATCLFAGSASNSAPGRPAPRLLVCQIGHQTLSSPKNLHRSLSDDIFKFEM